MSFSTTCPQCGRDFAALERAERENADWREASKLIPEREELLIAAEARAQKAEAMRDIAYAAADQEHAAAQKAEAVVEVLRDYLRYPDRKEQQLIDALTAYDEPPTA